MIQHGNGSRRACTLFFTVLLSTLSVACSSGSGSGGSCGTAEAGETCETNDDCVCSLDCKDQICIAVVGTPGVSATEPEPEESSVPTSPLATQLCNKILDLPCVPLEISSDPEALAEGLKNCSEEMSKTIQKFQEAGCSSETTQAFNCMIGQITCPANAEDGLDIEDLMQEASANCTNPVGALQSCADAARDDTEDMCASGLSCASSSASEGEAASTCSVSTVSDLCTGSRAQCSSREDAEGTSFLCHCEGGPKDGTSFVAYADNCCQVTALVVEACGSYAIEENQNGSVPESSPPPSAEGEEPESSSEPIPDSQE